MFSFFYIVLSYTLIYTSRYFFIDLVLPNIPIPIPNIKYTVTNKLNISENLTNSNPILCNVTEFIIWDINTLYAPPTSKIVNAPDIIPIIIPSIINGNLIKLFVAPTYFIIDISLLLAYTVSFIVFDIITTEITINNINIFTRVM